MIRNSKVICLAAALAALLTLTIAPAARAGTDVYRDGDRYVEIGGRMQLQYHVFDPERGSSEDELFFRRLRLYVETSVIEDWVGKLQFDVGGSSGDNELSVKDAWLSYNGFDAVRITVGNQKPPFSREFLISSRRQGLVERTFVGDHNYGAPDRMAGIRLDGDAADGLFSWAASFGAASIDPDARRLDFDTPVNRNDDFNEGWLTVGRVEVHPIGEVGGSQGDLKRGPLGLTLAAAAFTWSNDGDNDTYTAGGAATNPGKADVDQASGFELSGGLRGGGLSLDAQIQRIEADTVDPTFDGGLYVDGSTEIEQLAVEAGWMLLTERLEIVGGWESQDADGYADAWTRTSLGLNWYLDGHDLKGQLTWRMGENLDGVPGADADEIFLQLQYVF